MEESGPDYKKLRIEYHEHLRAVVKQNALPPREGESTNFAAAELGQEFLRVTDDFEQKYGR